MRSEFITNSGMILYHLISMDSPTLRSISNLLDLSERAVQRIVKFMEEDGIIKRYRVEDSKRQNRYEVNLDAYVSAFPNPITVKALMTAYGISEFHSTDRIKFNR